MKNLVVYVRKVALVAVAITAVSAALVPTAQALPNCRVPNMKFMVGDGDAELRSICDPPEDPLPRPPKKPPKPPAGPDCSMYDNANHYIETNPLGDRGFENADFGFCDEATKLAYHDQAHSCRKVVADWVCAAPKADAINDPANYDSIAERCKNVDKRTCQIGAGGEAGTNRSTHVASGACYQTAPTGDSPYDIIRCCCGCFPGDVKVLSTYGYVPMDQFEQMTSKNIRLATPLFADSEELTASAPLKKADLVRGPEEKPVITIKTDNGAELVVTDMHPVLTVNDGEIDMKQAHELKVGDVLFTELGEATLITDLSEHMLPAEANTVYNVYVPADTGDHHVIIANELRTGDRAWQDALSARGSFEYSLSQAAAD